MGFLMTFHEFKDLHPDNSSTLHEYILTWEEGDEKPSSLRRLDSKYDTRAQTVRLPYCSCNWTLNTTIHKTRDYCNTLEAKILNRDVT